jgi:hypothetical protein
MFRSSSLDSLLFFLQTPEAWPHLLLTTFSFGSKLRRMKPPILSILLLAPALAFAQVSQHASMTIGGLDETPPPNAKTEAIPITDLSPEGAPVKYFGEPIPCFEWLENGQLMTKANGQYHMSNVSRKTIIALVGHTEEACLHGGSEGGDNNQNDLFLKPAGIPAAKVLDLPVLIELAIEPFDLTAPSHSRIIRKVLWAQFDDGSQWGDKAAAKDLLQRRAESLQFYQRLANESDQTKLLEMLEEKSPSSDSQRIILRNLNRYRSQYGLPAVILMIKETARIGSERIATGKF